MDTVKRKKRMLVDRKNAFVYLFWTIVNKICIAVHFKGFRVNGKENIPKSGPFLLLANHTSRWDGLIVCDLIGRPSNFMVSPNELLGFQGTVLTSMGSFPADPRADLIKHALSQFKKGEGVVVFPEGNIFRDGSTHQFKTGAAKIALAAAEAGISLPVIPAAIHYAQEGKVASISVGAPVNARDYICESKDLFNKTLRALSDRMHREVCYLKEGLGSLADHLALYGGTARRHWPEMVMAKRKEEPAPKLQAVPERECMLESHRHSRLHNERKVS